MLTKSKMIRDQLYPSSSAVIGGFIGERLNNCYQNRILAQDSERLIKPFHTRPESTATRSWKNEFWGKWFTSAVLAYRYRPDSELKRILDESIQNIITTQTPDGYIGTYSEKHRFELFDIWGIKYTLLGLLDYYDLTKDENILGAACKFTDYLIQEVDKRNLLLVKIGFFRGMGTTSILEPIILIYAYSGKQRYLDFAEEIVRQIESPDGTGLVSRADEDVAERYPIPKEWFSWDQGQKAYEMMSNYEGLVELYRQTGNSKYKIAAEKVWQNIEDTEINVVGSGSSSECWFGGKKLQIHHVHHYQETCVTVTWLKLSHQLLRLTGEAKYADAIEKTYFNSLLGAMKPDGEDWAKYSPVIGHRMNADEQCGMELNCCSANGPRGLFLMPHTVVMNEKEGIRINFFLEGNYSLETPGRQSASVIMKTDYPFTGSVQIKLSLPKDEAFLLRVRIPAWSSSNNLKVNEQAVDDVNSGEYAVIRRTWKSGDTVTLEMDMRGRVEKLGGLTESQAILRGPVVLARDLRLGGLDVDASITPVTTRDGYVELVPIAIKENAFWMKFSAQFKVESHLEEAQSDGGFEAVSLLLCDYASAGNTYDQDSRFRVWLPQNVNPKDWFRNS